jgi:signal transduction histidine kinase
MKMEANAVAMRAERGALLGIADADLARRLTAEVERTANHCSISSVRTLAQLYERMQSRAPRVIFVADDILEDLPITEILRQLTAVAPVVLVADPRYQPEVARLVAEGDVEFVARVGDFVPLAACLIQRRSRWAERSESKVGPPWSEIPADVAEIFRHEINNPLTGILGNAELVLSHGDRLSSTDTQRLRTIVDLAVRLRETIRRLSQAWQNQPPVLKPL